MHTLVTGQILGVSIDNRSATDAHKGWLMLLNLLQDNHGSDLNNKIECK
jgi:hypothetical protein